MKQPIEKLIKPLKFDYVNQNITEINFPDTGRRGEVKVLHFDKYITSEDAIKEGEKQGLVPATPHELLMWAEKNWNGIDFIVALGQQWRVPGGGPDVVFLVWYDSWRYLSLYWFDDEWSESCRFAFCRPVAFLTTGSLGSEDARVPVSLDSKILAKTEVLTECWNWLGAKRKGYGLVRWQGKQLSVHRALYEILVAPIPKGYTIDHLCKNTACVNPAHLQPVTAGENSLRGDGPPAKNARKTHCHKGHPLSGENLHIRNDGRRVCKTCIEER